MPVRARRLTFGLSYDINSKPLEPQPQQGRLRGHRHQSVPQAAARARPFQSLPDRCDACSPVHIPLSLALLLAALALAATAQSAEQFITWGDRAMAAGEHYGASRYYGEALKQTPGTMELQWNYAEACRLSNQYADAAEYYDKVQRKDHARKHPEALRWLAEMQMSTGHYDEAEATWAKVKQKERKKDSFIAQRADNGLEGCRLAKALLADPDTVVRMEHLPMPVNSFDSELKPAPVRQRSTSHRCAVSECRRRSAHRQLSRPHLPHAEGSGSWAEPMPLPANRTTRATTPTAAGAPMGAGSTSPGRTHWASSASTLDLHNPGDTGTVALRVPGSTVTQPMVANHGGGEVLFFVSNRPGGQGGLVPGGGRGTEPSTKPLGAPVNTPGNETGPFDARDNTLYFSSDFLPGMGGYDPSKALDNNAPGLPSTWACPSTAPPTTLSAVYGNPASGWLTSNRAGSLAEKGETRCNDLYRFSYPGSEATVPPPAPDTPPPRPQSPRKRITSLRESCPSASTSTTTARPAQLGYHHHAGLCRPIGLLRPKTGLRFRLTATAAGSTAIDKFFSQQVDAGFSQLMTSSPC